MNIGEIITIIVGAIGGIGGVGGLISIYNAKSNKNTIDIKNLVSIIDEERESRVSLKKEYEDYKVSVDNRIRMFKAEFEQLKKDNEDYREENRRYTAAIYKAYRCPLPKTEDDCPVIKAYKDTQVTDACNVCDKKNNQ